MLLNDERTLNTEDFKLINNLFKEGFINWAKDNIGVTTVLHNYRLFNNNDLINSGFTKAPFLELYVCTDRYDIIEVIYYLGMDFLSEKGINELLNESKLSYVGEIILDTVNDYIAVYPLSDLD